MARPKSASAKTERLLNLVIALLYTRQPMSKARIRVIVPQYADAGDEAFDRMFERDKGDLRDLGIPLRTEVIDPLFDDETGYRIDRREYALPEVEFSPDELAVIGLASRSWSQASLAGPAARALHKLEAAGLSRDDRGVAGIEPLLHTVEPAFEPVRAAVLAGRAISFGYRGGSLPQRRVEPWRLTSWRGRWYLTGYDLDREAPRVFRLDRIEGQVHQVPEVTHRSFAVPPDHDPVAMITANSDDAAPASVHVAVRAGAGQTLRRRAARVRTDHPEPGWDLLELSTPAVWQVIEEVAGFGPDARVTGPPEAVTRWREHLTAVVTAHAEGHAG